MRLGALYLAAFLSAWAAGGCTRRPAAPPPKLILVGIDGATWKVIQPRLDSLPNFRRLREGGSWGQLQTLEPTLSPAIWTTIATGVLPARHGIEGFLGDPGVTMRSLPTSNQRRAAAFWNVLGDAGFSVGVIGWWVTWPAEAVNGWMVSDRATYSRMKALMQKNEMFPLDVYPEDLAAEVRGLIREPNALRYEEVADFMSVSREDFEQLVIKPAYRPADFLVEFKYSYQSDRSILDLAEDLTAKHPVAVVAVYLAGVDTVSHFCWHFLEPEAFAPGTVNPVLAAAFAQMIPGYYRFTDRALGQLLQRADADTLVAVVSDHGFGPTGSLPWSGGHDGLKHPGSPSKPPGVIALYGPPFKRGFELADASVEDVTPTLLYALGAPVAENLDGRVLEEAFTPEFLRAHPRRTVKSYPPPQSSPLPNAQAAERDEELVRRLEALGYLK